MGIKMKQIKHYMVHKIMEYFQNFIMLSLTEHNVEKLQLKNENKTLTFFWLLVIRVFLVNNANFEEINSIPHWVLVSLINNLVFQIIFLMHCMILQSIFSVLASTLLLHVLLNMIWQLMVQLVQYTTTLLVNRLVQLPTVCRV